MVVLWCETSEDLNGECVLELCTLTHSRIVVVVCSLYSNSLGDDGGKALGEALKVNSTVTSIKWVHCCHRSVRHCDVCDVFRMCVLIFDVV